MIVGNGIANGTFMVAVNRIGTEPPLTFYGSSFISDPYGRVLVKAPRDEPAVLVADLDLDQRRDWLELFPFLRTRRPETYAALRRRGQVARAAAPARDRGPVKWTRRTRTGHTSRHGPDPGAPSTSDPPVVPTVGVGMHESRALQRAGWAGAASVVLLAVGVALGYLVGVDDPSMSDAAILERLNDDARQVAAGVGMPVLAAGIALLLWFATGLRRVLDRLSGGDPLAHAIVPAAALFGGLMITGVSLDVASALTAWSDEFTPDPDTARVLGTAGLVVALTGLIGGGALVAATTRIAQQARALPAWAVWASYAVAGLSLTGFWSGGMASVAFAVWLIGAVIGVLRAARRTPPAPGG